MLKIKDNVDLKELEKFGFRYDDEFGVGTYVKSKWYEEEVNNPTYGKFILSLLEQISILEKNREIFDSFNSQVKIDCDTLFDLIQAGLVEKVRSE